MGGFLFLITLDSIVGDSFQDQISSIIFVVEISLLRRYSQFFQ